MEKKINKFIDIRRETIMKLYELADAIDTIAGRSRKATIAGTAMSIVGGAVGVPLGIAATILSCGAAAPLAIAGMVFFGIGGAGSGTSIFARIGKHFHVKSKYKKALEAVKRDQKFGKEVFGPLAIAKGTVTTVGGLASGVEVGAKITRTVLKAGDATFDAINVAGNVIKISARISLAASIILLPLDVYTLKQCLKDISMDKRHEKAEEIRKWAHELEEELKQLDKTMDSN